MLRNTSIRSSSGRYIGHGSGYEYSGIDSVKALFMCASLPHRARLDAVGFTPCLVRKRRNLARLDLAAAAPEDVGVAHGDADLLQVRVDRALVGQHEVLVGAVGDAHDVHVAE